MHINKVEKEKNVILSFILCEIMTIDVKYFISNHKCTASYFINAN